MKPAEEPLPLCRIIKKPLVLRTECVLMTPCAGSSLLAFYFSSFERVCVRLRFFFFFFNLNMVANVNLKGIQFNSHAYV